MIFKDFDTLLSDGGGAYQQGEHFYCSAVKTMETKESTRTDTGGSAAAPHLQHFCHPRLPEHSQNFLPTWKRNHVPGSSFSGANIGTDLGIQAAQLFTPNVRFKKIRTKKNRFEFLHGNPTWRN